MNRDAFLRPCAERLQAFVAGLGEPSFPLDVAFDWLELHLWSDDAALFSPTDTVPRWHTTHYGPASAVALGSRNEGAFELAASQADALAFVLEEADDWRHELDFVRRLPDGRVEVTRAGERFALMEPTSFVDVPEALERRFHTLLAPVRTQDALGLQARLAELPAWTVTQDRLGAATRGDWRVRRTGARQRWGLRDAGCAKARVTADARSKDIAVQRRFPMHVTPNALAKVLQELLTERLGPVVKLSGCQEALAHVFGWTSWHTLAARFKQCQVPATLHCAPDDGRQPPAVFRSPVAMLAGLYQQACSLQAQARGTPVMHLQARWHGADGLRVRVRSGAFKEPETRAVEGAGTPPERRLRALARDAEPGVCLGRSGHAAGWSNGSSVRRARALLQALRDAPQGVRLSMSQADIDSRTGLATSRVGPYLVSKSVAADAHPSAPGLFCVHRLDAQGRVVALSEPLGRIVLELPKTVLRDHGGVVQVYEEDGQQFVAALKGLNAEQRRALVLLQARHRLPPS